MMEKINLLKIIQSKAFMETLEEAYKLNKPKIESGFLVQVRPKQASNSDNDDLSLELKMNKPMEGVYVAIDLGESFRGSRYGLPRGDKGEGFYLERGFHSLIHSHFHIPKSSHVPSKKDIREFYKVRQKNIKKAQNSCLSYFINPLFIVGNKNKKIYLNLLLFHNAKNINEYSTRSQLLALNTLEELKEREEEFEELSKHIIKELY